MPSGPEGGAELRAGWRDSCKEAPLAERRNEATQATGQDFTQLSVIRSTNARREGIDRLEWCPGGRDPLGKDLPDQARRRITDVV